MFANARSASARAAAAADAALARAAESRDAAASESACRRARSAASWARRAESAFAVGVVTAGWGTGCSGCGFGLHAAARARIERSAMRLVICLKGPLGEVQVV